MNPNNQELMLSDLSAFTPVSPKQDSYQIWDYELENKQTGKMLFASQLQNPPDMALKLPVKGSWKIYLGLPVEDGMGSWVSPMIAVKLKKEKFFRKICLQGPFFWQTVQEIYWKTAELDGNDELILSKLPGLKAGLVYVRLVEESLPTIQEPDSFELISTCDNYEVIRNVEDLESQIALIAQSQIKKLFFCMAHGDSCPLMPTRVGDWWGDRDHSKTIFNRFIDRDIMLSLRQLGDSGENVIGRLRQFTKAMGLEFHVSVRLEAFCGLPGADYFTSSFYRNNPQWRCRERDGREITRMSYAVPEVRQHMLALFAEMLSYDPDGLNLIFTRGLPMVLYERQLPGTAEEDFQYRSAVLSEFMREVRLLSGNRTISAVVPATPEVNKQFGLDPATWIREKTVDILCPDQSLQNQFHDESPGNIDLEYYANLTANTHCRCYPRLPSLHQLFPEKQYPMEIRNYFETLRTMGFAGALLWDGASTFSREPGVWECVRNAGRFSEADLPRRFQFRSLNHMAMDQYPPHMCY